MIVPHTANVGVPPQREDLTNDGHPAQRAVNQLHDVCITHLLKERTTGGVKFNGPLPLLCKMLCHCGTTNHDCAVFEKQFS